jgi:four helix bundle protein
MVVSRRFYVVSGRLMSVFTGASMGSIQSHKDLLVWQDAMDGAMEIYVITKAFPADEKYSLVDQIRRSSRSVAANLAEAWRKRRYEAAFKSKLNDAEAEASETQTWVEVALRCSYIDQQTANKLDQKYEHILTRLVSMSRDAGNWTL